MTESTFVFSTTYQNPYTSLESFVSEYKRLNSPYLFEILDTDYGHDTLTVVVKEFGRDIISEDWNNPSLLYECLKGLEELHLQNFIVRTNRIFTDGNKIKFGLFGITDELRDPMFTIGVIDTSNKRSDIYHLGFVFSGNYQRKEVSEMPINALASFENKQYEPDSLVLRMTSLFPECRPNAKEAINILEGKESITILPSFKSVLERLRFDIELLQKSGYLDPFNIGERSLSQLAMLDFYAINDQARAKQDEKTLKLLQECSIVPNRLKYSLSLNNTLEMILDEYPDKPWEWWTVSENPNLTWKFVQKHEKLPWNWYYLSKNPNVVTWEIFQDNPDKPWEWEALLKNPNITWEMVKDDLNIQNWQALSQNPNITWEIVGDDLNIQNWQALSQNPNITWKIVQENMYKPWNWTELSANPNVATWQAVNDYPDKWSWKSLLKNPNITWDLLEKYRYKWDWYNLSASPHLTWEIIQENNYELWNWKALSENPSIATWEIVRNNPDEKWDWYLLSKNPNVATWEIVQANPSYPWNWKGISENPNITWEIVRDNPDEKWDWYGLSGNPNLTFDVVYANHNLIDWQTLSSNLFLKDPFLIERERVRVLSDISLDLQNKYVQQYEPHVFEYIKDFLG